MKLGNERGIAVIGAIALAGFFAFLCWITEARYDTPQNDPQEVVDKR
jgi:NADH dehydrogenase FAD-containing subunit